MTKGCIRRLIAFQTLQRIPLCLSMMHAFTASKKTLNGILGTNAIVRGDRAAFGDCVVCKTISRFNHSCIPNIEQSWNEDTFKLELYACIDIPAGDELCLYYTDLRATRSDRAEHLLNHYRFQCDCPACAPATVAESDNRRVRAMQLGGDILAVGPKLGIPLVAELLEIYEVEKIHLHTLRGQACFVGFQLHLCIGEMSIASSWMEKTYGHRKMCHGPDHATTLRAMAYLQNPETHPAFEAWQRRKARLSV